MLLCLLKRKRIPSSLQLKNHICGHWRSVNFLHYVTSIGKFFDIIILVCALVLTEVKADSIFMQPENKIWGHERGVNFLRYVTSYCLILFY